MDVGIIGFPLRHSISPVFQQAAIDDLGFTYVTGPPNNTVFEDWANIVGSPVFRKASLVTQIYPDLISSTEITHLKTSLTTRLQGLLAKPARTDTFQYRQTTRTCTS